MASQYDAIGSKYNVFKTLPTSILETDSVEEALLPYLSKPGSRPRVLDLACGTGFYSRKLLGWGAHYVLGIDLSEAMVQAARESLSDPEKPSGTGGGSVKFAVGDALHLGKIPDEEPFDVVLGVWLLNYASSLADMTQMFRSISANLREGGVFVGIMPHPTPDLDAFARGMNRFEKENPARWGITVRYYERLASGEGWKTEVIAHSSWDEVAFRNYHLRREVYEEAARDGGMRGRLEWREPRRPEHAVEGMDEQAWNLYFTMGPHMGVLVVEK